MALMSESRVVMVETAPLRLQHVLKISGITVDAIKAAKPGEHIRSTPVVGGEWAVAVFLGGSSPESAGQVSAHVVLCEPDCTRCEALFVGIPSAHPSARYLITTGDAAWQVARPGPALR